MPRGSEELTDKRKLEIIDACGSLYRSRGFREITIKDISAETTFSRPSIYNYFETKEEIFLALLEREYEEWTKELCKIAESGEAATCDRFSRLVAKSLGRREALLKISAMNLYEIEEHSRTERLVEFKKTFKSSAEAFSECLEKCLPDCGKAKREEVRYAFFPFMYGIYPYTHPTEKQCEAMKRAKLSFEVWSVEKLVYHFLKQLLK